MKKSLTTGKRLVLFTLILGLIGSLTTFFLLQEETKSSDAPLKEKKEIKTVKGPPQPLKSKQDTKKTLSNSNSLYVPPETFIGIQKLNFESIKNEIKAQKEEEKKTYDKSDYKREKEDPKNVFLSLINIE